MVQGLIRGITRLRSRNQRVPDDWKTFTGRGIEISVPGSYVGGEPGKKDFDSLIETFRSRGDPVVASYLQQEAANPQTVLLGASTGAPDFGVCVSAYLNTSIRSDGSWSGDLFAARGYAEALMQQLSALPLNYKIIERTPTKMAGHRAEAIVWEFDSPSSGRRVRELAYVIGTGGGIWGLTYSAPSIADFERLVQTFRKSARTLKIA
jgi:hypothetical protein